MNSQFRIRASIFALALLPLLTASCSLKNRIETKSNLVGDDDSKPAVRTLSFTEWCTEWQIACPTGEAPDVPTPGKPWSPDQWQQAFALVQAVGDSKSYVVVDREDMADENLDDIAHPLGIEPQLQQVRESVSQANWLAFTVPGEGKPFLAAFEKEGNLLFPDSLAALHAKEIKLGISKGEVVFGGIKLVSPTGANEIPMAIRVTAENLAEVSGKTLKVEQVPIAFILAHFAPPTPEDPSDVPNPNEILSIATPLRNWIVSDHRRIHLEQNFFALSASALPNLVDFSANPETGKSLSVILSSIEKLDSGWDTGAEDLFRFQMQPDKTVQCKVEGAPVVVEFMKQFGIKEFGNTGTGSAFVDVFGVRAKIDLPGPFDPWFELTRIEFTGTKIIIKNVPIVHDYPIPLVPGPVDPTDPNNPIPGVPKSMSCSN